MENYKTARNDVFKAQFNPQTLADIRMYIKLLGFHKPALNFGVDFTLKNWYGTVNLHKLHKRRLNPYQSALKHLCDGFGDRELPISLYGFGDIETQDLEVFSMSDMQKCIDSADAISLYNSAAQCIEMSGPRSFVPMVNEVIQKSRSSKERQILFILTNGLPEDIGRSVDALVDASFNDVSVIIIGIGSGPWQGFTRLCNDHNKKYNNTSFLQHTAYDESSSPVEFLREVVITVERQLDDLNTLSQESEVDKKDT